MAVSTYKKGTTNEQSRDEYEYIGKTIIQKHYDTLVLGWNRIYTLDDNGNIIKKETVYPAGSSNQNFVEEWLDYDDKQNLVGPQVGDVVSKK